MPKGPKETSDEYFATARLGISTSVHRLWRKGHEEWHVVVSRLMEKTARAALAFEEFVHDQLVWDGIDEFVRGAMVRSSTRTPSCLGRSSTIS